MFPSLQYIFSRCMETFAWTETTTI